MSREENPPDMIVIESKLLGDSLSLVSEVAGKGTIVAVLDYFTDFSSVPNAPAMLRANGFEASVIPLGGGVILAARRFFDNKFLLKTVEIWRKGMTEGPMPIQYNTARLLYIVTLFLLSDAKSKVAVEIGSGLGFSTLWLSTALKEVKGKLYTFDIAKERCRCAEEAVSSIGVREVTEVVCEDAKIALSKIESGVALVFIDGAKEEYYDYLNSIKQRLLKGAVIMAHNAVSNADDMIDYILEVFGSDFDSLVLFTDPAGLLFSVRK